MIDDLIEYKLDACLRIRPNKERRMLNEEVNTFFALSSAFSVRCSLFEIHKNLKIFYLAFFSSCN